MKARPTDERAPFAYAADFIALHFSKIAWYCRLIFIRHPMSDTVR